MSKRITLFSGLFMAFVLMLSACAPAATPTQAPPPAEPPTSAPVPTTVPPTVDPMVEMLQAAQKEATIVSYGLPDDWVNYGGLFKGFTAKYNITHQDTDMDSGTIISTLQSEASAPVADTTDLGLAFAKLVEDSNLSQPYMNSHWSDIPDYAKDAQGRWSAAYWGAMAFLVNADKVKAVPATWEDLLKADYKNTVCMKDPRSSATAQMIVLASAYAHGGDENNVATRSGFLQEDDRRWYPQRSFPVSSQYPEGRVPDHHPVGLRRIEQ